MPRTLQAAALAALAAALAACGDDGIDLDPAPDQITEGPVTITTDPLRITVTGPAGSLEQDDFLEIATVDTIDPNHYYDPRDAGFDPLTWTVANQVRGVDGDGWLVLDGGARLRLAPGPRPGGAILELDATGIEGAVLTRLVLPIDAGEPIHGFGESFGGADAAGQVREAQFRVDLSTESGLNEAHVPVPLALWPRRGAGLFVEDRRVGAFDLGAARAGEVLSTFGLPDRGPLPIHLFVAEEPLDLVRHYVALTALPAVPPRWAFAPQQWRNVHDNSGQIRDDATTMRSLGIPGSVMWIDNPWQTGYNTFVIDEQRFVGIDALLAELEGLGYRVIFWSTPYLLNEGETEADYQEARAAGYFVTDSGGTVLDFPWKEGPVGLVDFTNPDAVEFWRERIARVVARGASGFKLDYGEDVVPELGGSLFGLRLAAGDNQDLHGIFARYYHDAYLGALPDGDGFLITRAGAWGEQDRNTCIWPGDLDSDFSRFGVDNGEGMGNTGGLPAAIAGGLSLSVSGYPFYGSDIGGYREGPTTSEALIRWSQYAALGTIMQLGGGGESHNPWDTDLFPAPALEVYLEYSRLHMDLNPYLWTLALQAGADGTPVTRPCRFVHPDTDCDDAMFLLGDAILVAPVVEQGATTREVTLPPGTWINWWTLESQSGTVVVDAPLEQMPMWQEAFQLVPMFARGADTLEPASAPGVTSYADPAYGRELRFLNISGGSVELHDGAYGSVTPSSITFIPGTQYDIATFEYRTPAGAGEVLVVDGPALPQVSTLAELETCPTPGCWFDDAATFQVRIVTPGRSGLTVLVQ